MGIIASTFPPILIANAVASPAAKEGSAVLEIPILTTPIKMASSDAPTINPVCKSPSTLLLTEQQQSDDSAWTSRTFHVQQLQ